MPDKFDMEAINPLFRWHWPWPEPGDPGPPWESILTELDRSALIRLAAVQLGVTKTKLEAQRAVLDAQVKAVGQMQEIIGGRVK
jgi:hypothetical protein